MKQATNKTAPAKAQASITSLTLKQISDADLKTELTRCIGIHRLTKNQIIKRFEFDSTPELVSAALSYLVAGGTAYVLGGRYFLTSGGCRPHTDGKPQTETKPAAHTPNNLLGGDSAHASTFGRFDAAIGDKPNRFVGGEFPTEIRNAYLSAYNSTRDLLASPASIKPEFINQFPHQEVRAVNSHDFLVETLKRIEDHVKHCAFGEKQFTLDAIGQEVRAALGGAK